VLHCILLRRIHELGDNAAPNFMIGPSRSPIVAKKDSYPQLQGNRGISMQTKRIYQVQHWPDGEWDCERNWQKVEAGSEKEAAEKVCGRTLKERGKLAQLRARVLTLGDLKRHTATAFYAAD
jgi:hypothetical protein